MDLLLREFIAQRLGETGPIPSWIEKEILDLKKKVEQLEAGTGLSVTIKDQIALNIHKDESNNGIVESVIIPLDGTVENFTGFAETLHTKASITITRTSTTLGPATRTVEITSNPQFLNLGLEVRAGDILTFSLEGTGRPDDTPADTADFTNISGSFAITLPAKSYGADSARS